MRRRPVARVGQFWFKPAGLSFPHVFAIAFFVVSVLSALPSSSGPDDVFWGQLMSFLYAVFFLGLWEASSRRERIWDEMRTHTYWMVRLEDMLERREIRKQLLAETR